jgi:lysyl-tRNA synthetase class 2
MDTARLTRLRHNLEMRALMLDAIRNFFRSQGFLEVETPTRTPSPAPEAHIDATPSGQWYLITSPELHMKRLLAAGYERIFQITKCFRSGERGRLHNPEFTMLEWYRAHAGYLDILDDMERLVAEVAVKSGKELIIEYAGQRLDLTPPWERMAVADAFEEFAGWRPGPEPDPDRFNIDLVEKVEPRIGRGHPTVLLDYPAAMASLARLKPGNPGVAERFEVYAGGLELANAFGELADAEEQRQRFMEESQRRQAAGRPTYPMPEPFLAAMENMPPASGIALGVDRLVMLLCNASSIDEVVAFTQDTA